LQGILRFSVMGCIPYIRDFQIKENSMVRLTRYFLLILLMPIVPAGTIKAAEVSCGFLTENIFSKSGEWLAQDDNWQKLLEIFPDGVLISLDPPLDRKLDSTEVF
ncbi:MAG: hypothetical protein VX886_06180, partial [Pseudomonadota bacterium]|nr:hypothetical protein [Pseudomonadota bacterium]